MLTHSRDTRYLRWLDGDTTFLFIFSCVCETGFSSPSRGNDASLRHKRVRQGWLSVVNVSNHRHVTDVGLLVHDGTDLVDCEVHLRRQNQVSTFTERGNKHLTNPCKRRKRVLKYQLWILPLELMATDFHVVICFSAHTTVIQLGLTLTTPTAYRKLLLTQRQLCSISTRALCPPSASHQLWRYRHLHWTEMYYSSLSMFNSSASELLIFWLRWQSNHSWYKYVEPR